ARGLPLEFWDDVKKVAFARKIEPVPLKIVAMSTHAHALSLGTLSLVVTALALGTRLASGTRRARGFVGGMVAVTGVALLFDLGSWWLARSSDLFVYLIAGSGTVYSVGTGLLIGLILVDLWWPKKR